jgi:hypothetical protein
LSHGGLHRDMQHARKLLRTGNQLAIVAAFLEEIFRMRLLKEVGADFAGWNVRGNRQNASRTAVAIKESIDEMEISRTTTAGANRQFAGKLRFRPRGESASFLVPNMDPFDLAAFAYRVCYRIEAVAHHPLDPLNAGFDQSLDEFIRDAMGHVRATLKGRRADTRSAG